MGHVPERGIEPKILRLQLGLAVAKRSGALLHQLIEPAIELLNLLDHQRDRAIGAMAIVIRLLVGLRDEREQRLKVQFAGVLGRFCELSGKEFMHRRVPVPPRSS